MDTLRQFPIGKFVPQDQYSEEEISQILSNFAVFPAKLKAVLSEIPESSWDNPYREGGWTLRQVVHHLADSHSIMYFRVKQSLTVDSPSVPGYPESRWAALPDQSLSPWVSVQILESIHLRLSHTLSHFPQSEWTKKSYFHTGYETWNPLDRVLAMYVWHGEHHLAHIRLAA